MSSRTTSKLPTIHSGDWDPVFQVCNDTGVTLCMHIGSSSTNPVGVTRRARRRRRHARVQQLDGVARRLAVLAASSSSSRSSSSRTPRARSAGSPTRSSGPTRCGTSTTAGSTRRSAFPSRRRRYYYGRIFGCFTADHHGLHSLAEVGEDNICFETDYPHTDTTWPNSKEYVEKMLADFDENIAYKVLRGNAIKMLELDRV